MRERKCREQVSLVPPALEELEEMMRLDMVWPLIMLGTLTWKANQEGLSKLAIGIWYNGSQDIYDIAAKYGINVGRDSL